MSLYTYQSKSFQLDATHDCVSQHYLYLCPLDTNSPYLDWEKHFFNVSGFGFVFGGFWAGGALFDFHETYEFTLTLNKKA